MSATRKGWLAGPPPRPPPGAAGGAAPISLKSLVVPGSGGVLRTPPGRAAAMVAVRSVPSSTNTEVTVQGRKSRQLPSARVTRTREPSSSQRREQSGRCQPSSVTTSTGCQTWPGIGCAGAAASPVTGGGARVVLSGSAAGAWVRIS